MTPVCSLRLVDFMWQFLRLGRLAVLVCYWLVFRCVDMVVLASVQEQLRVGIASFERNPLYPWPTFFP